MTFKQWLLRFDAANLPIGDIAREVKHDTDFPENNNLDAILNYLEEKGACDAVIVAFKHAWDDYLSEYGPE